MKNLSKKQNGFTIVEVMIVLAIAGLVLAIVFIAVPALQRNSRDSQRRADVSALQSAVATFVGNNNGAVPHGANLLTELQEAVSSIDFSFYNATPTAITDWDSAQTERSIHAVASNGSTSPVVASTATLNNSFDFVLYVEDAVCNNVNIRKDWSWKAGVGTDTGAADGTTHLLNDGPARSYAIVYALEGDPNWQCIDNV